MCCLCVLSVFSLTGCKSELSTLKSDYEALQLIYSKNKDVFTSGELSYEEGSFQTKYYITFNAKLNEKIDSSAFSNATYKELRNLYNLTFAISHDYIDKNMDFILNRNEKELSKRSKEAIKKLDEVLVDYRNSVSDFVRERKSLLDYFSRDFGSDDQFQEEIDENHLMQFKRNFGSFVGKNINLALSLASAIETTDIFTWILETMPTNESIVILKEYIRAKILPIFTSFRIDEVSNKFNWNLANSQDDKKTKERMQLLMNSVNSQLTKYEDLFVSSNHTLKSYDDADLSVESLNELWALTQNFLKEAEHYYTALRRLDMKGLSLRYWNLEQHLRNNKWAENDIKKLEQFIRNTLDVYMNQVQTFLFD